MENKRNKALKKSIGNSIKIEINDHKYIMKKSTFKKYAISFALIIAMATLAISKLVGNAIDQTKLYNYTEVQRNVVASQTKPTEDGKNFWYDNHDIAKYLLEEGSNNFDENLYGVYYNIGYNDNNKIKMTNEILEIMNDIIQIHPEENDFERGYKNFDEYLVANGFVDKDGKPSIEQYEKYMETVTIAKAENNTDEFKM